MATLTNEGFRDAILTRYQVPALLMQRSDVATQLDESLRERMVTLWDKILLLESMVATPPTGDQDAILDLFRGYLDGVVEIWQQSMLALPRATPAPTDLEFRNKVIGQYSAPCAVSSPTDIARSLDLDLATSLVAFRELVFQLHYGATILRQTSEHDLGEQIKLILKQVVELWKKSILNRPRLHAGVMSQTAAK